MVRSSFLLLLLFGAACGSNGAGSGPCDVVPPDPACNLTCDAQPGAPASCPEGFYCNPDGKCYAQCTQTGDQCGDGYTCTYDGHCQPGDPGMGSGSGSNDCPRVAFMAKPVIPSIILLLDRSGSMREAFGNTNKWNAVRTALTDPTTGVVSQLETKAYFSATTYEESGGGACPRLTSTAERKLNNAAAIRMLVQADPVQNASTPTAKSIEAAKNSFIANPPPAGSPPIIVLATDGVPYVCNQGQTDDRAGSVAAAKAAYESALKIQVIPLSVGNAVGDQHLQDVANAGAGVQAGQPNAKFYKGNNPAELKAAFDTIIGGVVSCDLTVNGDVTQDQAAGAVIRLNGRELTFGTDWTLVGNPSRTIRILGTSCDMLKAATAPTVEGTFPCGVVLE